MSTPIIKFKRLQEGAKLPIWATTGSIGADLFAHIISENGRQTSTILPPRNTRAISTGLAIEPPELIECGWTPMVLSRSGLALKSIFVANAPGLIDSDYRGELKVLLYNGGLETEYISHGMRIAQLVLVRTSWFSMLPVDELSTTERGLGSTGP